MPTFLHCHCHHPNINHKFLSGYLPTSHCFPNSTPHNSLFAEQPKQSFKSKSGPLSRQLQDLHQLPTAHLQWNPNPFNSHTRAALANLSSFIPNHSTPYPPCHGPTNFLLFFKHHQVVPPRNFALANPATSTALHGRLHLVWDLSLKVTSLPHTTPKYPWSQSILSVILLTTWNYTVYLLPYCPYNYMPLNNRNTY